MELASPEHANLIDDVLPVTRRLQLLCQQPVQLLSHINDPPGHCAHIPFPLLEELPVVQYKCDLDRFVNTAAPLRYFSTTHHSCAPRRRITDLAALQYRKLTLHSIRGILFRGYYVQCSYSLAIQASVLGKALWGQVSFSAPPVTHSRIHTWQTSIGTPRSTKYLTA